MKATKNSRVLAVACGAVVLSFVVACGSRTKTSAPLPPAPKPVTPTTEKEGVKATKKAIEASAQAGTTKKEKAAPKMPTKEILESYRANPTVAEDAHLRKRYRFEGDFHDFVGESVFLWNNKEDGGKVLARMPREELKKIQRGDHVIIEGSLLTIAPGEGNLPDFFMGLCVVIESKPKKSSPD